MYIPPGFIVITCEPVDEKVFRDWAIDTGGAWRPAWTAWNGSHQLARAERNFGPYQEMTTELRGLSEEDKAEWMPRERMHAPPQALIEVELSESMDEDTAQYIAVLQSLFDCWNSYIHDLRTHECVSSLLAELLPSVRLFQRELPPPRPPSPWI